MSGLNASKVSDDDLDAIKAGLASVLDGVDAGDVYDVAVTDSARRLRGKSTVLPGFTVPEVRRALRSSSATVSFRVAVDIATSSFSDKSDLLSSVSLDLSDADADSTDLISAIQVRPD